MAPRWNMFTQRNLATGLQSPELPMPLTMFYLTVSFLWPCWWPLKSRRCPIRAWWSQMWRWWTMTRPQIWRSCRRQECRTSLLLNSSALSATFCATRPAHSHRTSLSLGGSWILQPKVGLAAKLMDWLAITWSNQEIRTIWICGDASPFATTSCKLTFQARPSLLSQEPLRMKFSFCKLERLLASSILFQKIPKALKFKLTARSKNIRFLRYMNLHLTAKWWVSLSREYPIIRPLYSLKVLMKSSCHSLHLARIKLKFNLWSKMLMHMLVRATVLSLSLWEKSSKLSLIINFSPSLIKAEDYKVSAQVDAWNVNENHLETEEENKNNVIKPK